MTDALANFAITGKLNFKNFADSVIRDLARIAYEKALAGIFNSVANAYGLTNSGLGRGTESQMYANSLKSANGNVFSGSSGLSAYSGSIVSKPTMFAFARGAGLMGEAGPEAVLPLTRGKGGKLGVVAQGGGGIEVQINITNKGQAVQARQTGSRMNGKKMMIDLVLDTVSGDVAKGGKTAQAMQQRFGLQRAGVPVGGA